jgi:hypothetical protein
MRNIIAVIGDPHNGCRFDSHRGVIACIFGGIESKTPSRSAILFKDTAGAKCVHVDCPMKRLQQKLMNLPPGPHIVSFSHQRQRVK